MKQFVIYTRVSTKSQGDSGLGLEAQERDIRLYLENYAEPQHEVIGTFCDVESGTKPFISNAKKMNEIKNTNDGLVLKRSKPLQRNQNSLESALGLVINPPRSQE